MQHAVNGRVSAVGRQTRIRPLSPFTGRSNGNCLCVDRKRFHRSATASWISGMGGN